MTVSGAWSRYRRARPPKSPRLGRWQQVSPTHLTRSLPLVFGRLSLIIWPSPTRAELTAARRAAHSFAALGRARVLHVPGADADASRRSQLPGASEAECDHERHPAPRAVGYRQRRCRLGRVPTTTPKLLGT